MLKQIKQDIRPSCGELVKEPYKTWELVACGKSFRVVVSKAKLVAGGIDV
jgi:hypothetical protein